jgi:hypothetical protein
MLKHNKYNFLDNLEISDEVKEKLSSNLLSIEKGSQQILSSPLAKQPDKVLSDWDTIFKRNSGKINNELNELELSNRSKFGPRSIAVPWVDRKSGVQDYFSAQESSKSPKVAEGLRQNLRPINEVKAISLLKNNTNSGMPLYSRKGNVKEDYMGDINKYLNRKDPCVLFTRTQEQKKTRSVWGYPMADTINEMRFYAPLLEYQRKLDWRSSINSPDAVNSRMTYLINKAIDNNLKLLSIDFSAYDASVKTALQKGAFSYVKSLFQSQFHKDIDYIEMRFNEIGLITPDGVLSGPHGVPSGSTFTNEVDSVAQFLIANENGETDYDIQGDDGAYCTADPDKLISLFESYGLNVNKDKSYVSDSYLVYLQNLYHKDYENNGLIGGIYPTYRALNRILYLERFTDFEQADIVGSDYFSIRTICILENCKYHPLFEELVKFIFKLDKYNLEYTRNGLQAYIQNIKQTSGTQGILNFRYEDDITGIESFETVKVLKSLTA